MSDLDISDITVDSDIERKVDKCGTWACRVYMTFKGFTKTGRLFNWKARGRTFVEDGGGVITLVSIHETKSSAEATLKVWKQLRKDVYNKSPDELVEGKGEKCTICEDGVLKPRSRRLGSLVCTSCRSCFNTEFK